MDESTGRRWSACGAWWGLVGGFWGEGLMLLNITSLLLGDAPQRRPTTGRCARSREVGVGHTEDFADGGGGYGTAKTCI